MNCASHANAICANLRKYITLMILQPKHGQKVLQIGAIFTFLFYLNVME